VNIIRITGNNFPPYREIYPEIMWDLFWRPFHRMMLFQLSFSFLIAINALADGRESAFWITLLTGPTLYVILTFTLTKPRRQRQALEIYEELRRDFERRKRIHS